MLQVKIERRPGQTRREAAQLQHQGYPHVLTTHALPVALTTPLPLASLAITTSIKLCHCTTGRETQAKSIKLARLYSSI